MVSLPTSSLGLLGLSRLLVLGHLHLSVLVALGAVGVTTLGHVHHLEAVLFSSENRRESIFSTFDFLLHYYTFFSNSL